MLSEMREDNDLKIMWGIVDEDEQKFLPGMMNRNVGNEKLRMSDGNK